MRQNSTLSVNRIFKHVVVGILFLVLVKTSSAQTTLALGNPATTIYGLTSNGLIYEINTANGNITKTIKNGTYSGNSPSNSNSLAYNSVNGRFYYFKRNYSSGSQEFVSFDPVTNTVTILASSTITADTHTGCVSFDGKGYYTFDTQGNLHFYNILLNTWTKITSNVVDQNNNNVTSVIQNQSAGDMAIDGYGNIYFVTSSNSNYGLYKIPAPMPTTSVAKLTVNRVIAPTATTPTGNSIAGIAFNSNGQIFMGTRGDDKLYLLQNLTTLTFVGNFSNSDAGNDLTSLNFPLISVLPVKWISFDATAKDNSQVSLEWKVIELQNKGFYVQHSADGSIWDDVSFISSRNIAETEQTYAYSVQANLSGKQYYRIKQVDIDGKESYSVVRILSFSSSNSVINVWPNPARNTLNIDNQDINSSGTAKAWLYNLSGKLAMERKLQQGINAIDISSLAPGAYIVKSNNSRGDSFTRKIIKQ
jgi:hypothetical protein